MQENNSLCVSYRSLLWCISSMALHTKRANPLGNPKNAKKQQKKTKDMGRSWNPHPEAGIPTQSPASAHVFGFLGFLGFFGFPNGFATFACIVYNYYLLLCTTIYNYMLLCATISYYILQYTTISCHILL